MDETFRTELLEVNELQWKRFEADMNARFGAVKADRALDNMIRLMIVLWVATVVPLGGLLIVLFRALH